MLRVTTKSEKLEKTYPRKSKTISKTCLISGALVLALNSSAADFYEIIDMGSLGGNSVEAFAINNNNDVVGNGNGDINGDIFVAHAFVFKDSQSSIFDLGYLNYVGVSRDSSGNPVVPTVITELGRSLAFGINDNGIAVGYSLEDRQTGVDDSGNPINHDTNTATYYDVEGLTVSAIPSFIPDAPLESRALSVNDNNLVVGFGLVNPVEDVWIKCSIRFACVSRGFFFDIDTNSLTKVEPLASDVAQSMVLRAVNNDGFAVGISTETIDSISTSQVVAVDVNDPANVEKLEIFGGLTNQPWSVNSSKKIVGTARLLDSADKQAFIYDYPNQSVTEIGFLNVNFPYSEAFDINENDQVVGVSKFLSAPIVYHAFLYENDTLKDFNKLISCNSGWRLDEARSINDSGVVTGTGVFNGEKHAFMLKPLAGTAPNCEPAAEESGSGSLPLASLFMLALVRVFRRKEPLQ